jgi:hypothetical protein
MSGRVGFDDRQERAPLLSAVVVTPRDFRSISRTVQSLAAQSLASSIELVIVAPTVQAVETEAERLLGFHSVQIVSAGPITNVDHAAAFGLLRASAEIVASIEDHAFPDPDWAERVLNEWSADSAEGQCVAVGSTITNANPRSKLSWTNILIAYGQWKAGTPDGRIDWVPAHNITLRRSALQPLSNNLPPLMGREGLFLKELQKRGGKFRFASGARIAHVNPSTLSSTAALRFDAGRLYAARRAQEGGWSLAKRLFYVGLGPLIPFVRYARMRRDLFTPQSGLAEKALGPALFLGLVFDAAGQMLGYIGGAGGAPHRLAVFEMDRIQHLDAHDRRLFSPA